MSTREDILTELKRRGHARADDLAQTLGLTPMAVRQHLYQLQDEAAVTCCETPQGRGRPAKHWELTPKADTYFPDAHRDLSLDLIDSIRAVLGETALSRLVADRSAKQASRYRAAMKDEQSLEGKLGALAKMRAREGYMAEVQKTTDEAYVFLESHCPICEAAKACSGLCKEELAVFRSLLSQQATVDRVEHILAGGKRCAYRVAPKAADKS